MQSLNFTSLNFQDTFFGCIAGFVSDLVRNLEDRFSHGIAQYKKYIKLNVTIVCLTSQSSVSTLKAFKNAKK